MDFGLHDFILVEENHAGRERKEVVLHEMCKLWHGTKRWNIILSGM